MAHNQFTHKPLLQRMLEKTEQITESGCWIWMGAISGGGYGAMTLNGRPNKPHRVMYEIYRGAIPFGLDIDHLCRVRCCVNPWHLEPVTRKENCRRGLLSELSKSRAMAFTHCPRGHEYTAANTYRREIIRNGIKYIARSCRECALASMRAYGIKRRAKARAARAISQP